MSEDCHCTPCIACLGSGTIAVDMGGRVVCGFDDRLDIAQAIVEDISLEYALERTKP